MKTYCLPLNHRSENKPGTWGEYWSITSENTFCCVGTTRAHVLYTTGVLVTGQCVAQ